MTEWNSLVIEIRTLEKIQSELALVSQRTDTQRKLEMVQLRRQLSLQIGVISAEADKNFLAGASEAVAREFRSLLSAMRRAVALHQANWPAVKLDDQDSDYHESVKAVREANSQFLQWAKENIGN